MQCPRWHSIPGPLALQATALPTELKKISTNAVSRGGYESTTVSITLGKGEFPLHSPHPKSHHTLTISQISTIDPTSFPVQITVGYLGGHQCNSRACLTTEKCNVPDGIRSRDLSHCKPPLYQLS
jgi:hypothetical protein